MDSGVDVEVKGGYRSGGKASWGGLAEEGEDRPVVVWVTVHVEEIVAAGVPQHREHLVVGSLADVHDALKHRDPPCRWSQGAPVGLRLVPLHSRT